MTEGWSGMNARADVDCVILRKGPMAETAWVDVVGRLTKCCKNRLVMNGEMLKALLREAAVSCKRSQEN
jgi:hypothetical protein